MAIPETVTRAVEGVQAPLDVICIGGTGQNGATLLSRMLGCLPGVVTVGEIGLLWDKGLIENVECGCGLAFRECAFWTRVGNEAFGGWDSVDALEAVGLRRALTLRGRFPHWVALPLILWPGLRPGYGETLRAYQTLTERLYRGILSASGARVVVDSTKQPSHVYMVSRASGVRTRVVHLVRDSRGVAYSKTKWVPRQGADESRPWRVRRWPPKAAYKWLWMNASFHLLARLGVPTATARYESMVSSPAKHLRRIASFLELDVAEENLGFIQGNKLDLPPHHLVAGNRLRLRSGVIDLTVDDAWRIELPPRQRRAVSLLTWPLLRRYRYRWGPRRRRPPPPGPAA